MCQARSGWRKAITAAGTGAMAALEAERWLAHHGFAESPVPEAAEALVPPQSLEEELVAV